MGQEKRTQEDLFSELSDIKAKVEKLGQTGKGFKKCPVCKAYIDINEETDCPCGKASFDKKEGKWKLKETKKEDEKEGKDDPIFDGGII